MEEGQLGPRPSWGSFGGLNSWLVNRDSQALLVLGVEKRPGSLGHTAIPGAEGERYSYNCRCDCSRREPRGASVAWPADGC